jgi:hypothetical protein
MTESTTFPKEETRGIRQDLSSLHLDDRDGLDASMSATSGGGRGLTVPSACVEAGCGARESDPTIHFGLRPDATSEVETLARIYDFVIGAYKSRQAVETANRDKGEEAAAHNRAEGISPEKREA